MCGKILSVPMCANACACECMSSKLLLVNTPNAWYICACIVHLLMNKSRRALAYVGVDASICICAQSAYLMLGE